jgi:hypothetical protein
VIADETGEESCRLGAASVGRYQMLHVCVFVEGTARMVDGFLRAADARPDSPFENIADDGARVSVRRRGFAGPVGDFDQPGFQVRAVEWRQAV